MSETCHGQFLQKIKCRTNAGKCQNLMKFIVENTDPFTTAGCMIVFDFNRCKLLDGLTPIHLAAWCGLTDSVEYLIKKYENTAQHHGKKKFKKQNGN